MAGEQGLSLLDVLLGRKHPPMIGLDISSSSAKLVELGQTANGEFVLERFASEPVSYTHLDVYKRQTLGSVSRPSSNSSRNAA